MAQGSVESKWLTPKSIFKQTPSVILPRQSLPANLAFWMLLTPNFAISAVLWRLWHPAIILTVAPLAYSFYRWFMPITRFIRSARASLPLEELRKEVVNSSGMTGNASLVSGLQPGNWVQLKANHENERKLHKGSNGRVAVEPEIKFRLCIALYRLNGLRHRIAFSDGKFDDWTSGATALYRPYHPKPKRCLRYSADVDVNTRHQLLAFVDALSMKDCLAIQELIGTIREEGPVDESLLVALRAGYLWGILETEKHRDERRLLDFLATGMIEQEDLIVRLTDAGTVWMTCSPEALEEARKKAEMERKQQQARRITIKDSNVQGVYMGDITGGELTYNQYNYSDRELVGALEDLLNLPDVPWHSADDRGVVEAAVARKDPHQKGVQPVVTRVLEAAQRMGGGSLFGTALFELLKNFVSS